MINLSDQEIIRRQKKATIESKGIAPYPANAFVPDSCAGGILKNFVLERAEEFRDVRIAGRIMSIRVMGSASFMEIKDEEDKIQVYVSRDSIAKGEDKFLYNDFFKKLLDIGDIVGVRGYVFKTNVGVTSLHAEEIVLLSKAVKPLPVVKEVKDGGETKTYDAFSDPEARYRQRYVDLIVNSGVRDIFVKRSEVLNSIRTQLSASGYLEVETPILQPIYGGAAARPFTTHHNTLDMELFLRISPELYLKRLIVGGFNGVFEIAKNFRNEGMSRFHNPEFTMLELYVAYRDYKWMMRKGEEIIVNIVKKVNGSLTVSVDDKIIDFTPPWKEYTLFECIKKFTGIDVEKLSDKELVEEALKLKISVDDSFGRAKLIDEIFGSECEPKLIDPTFITDYPVEMSPLAKKKADNGLLVERFEVICNGKEICNAYSELNDPIDQRARFEEQLMLAKRGDKEAMMLDEDFLRALEYGMPPTAGFAIGIDRLVMTLTNSASIQEVLFFPQMRNKE